MVVRKESAPEDENIHQMVKDAQAITGDGKEVNGRLYGELGELAKYLNSIMKKVEKTEASMNSTTLDIPTVTVDISEVKRLTEEGTHRVLGFSESIQNKQDQMKSLIAGLREELKSETLNKARIEKGVQEVDAILEENDTALMDLVLALEFQDLVGQKLKKIASVLNEVQGRIMQLLVAFGSRTNGELITLDQQESLLRELRAKTQSETLNQALVDNILEECGF